MSAISGEPPASQPGRLAGDPASVLALAHLRHLVGGAAPDEVEGSAPRVPVPTWVPVSDRVRARWLRVPVAARAAVGAIGVLAGCGVAWWLVRPPPVPAEATLPTVVPPAAAPVVVAAGAGPTTTAGTLLVHAAGAVRHPGVIELLAGARVADVVEAAGGAAPDADLDRLNLAAPALDGSQVYVPRLGEEVPPAMVASAPPGTPAGSAEAAQVPTAIDLNAADQAALEELPGVGPATAAAIVAHREEIGRFTSVDELLDVPGIGPARFEAIEPLVVVSG